MQTDVTQAVILAAGKGTRMGELTVTIPKPMLKVQGKTLIEWKLEALPKSVSSVVMVIGYLGDVIQEYFGHNWKGIAITYVKQEELNGTAGALWAARPYLTGKFLVLMGDDIYHARDLAMMATHPLSLGVMRRENFTGGSVVTHNDMTLVGVKEGEHASGWFNVGCYVLDPSIFDYPMQLAGNGKSTEYGLPQTLALAANSVPIHCYEFEEVMQITNPDDIEKANRDWKI